MGMDIKDPVAFQNIMIWTQTPCLKVVNCCKDLGAFFLLVFMASSVFAGDTKFQTEGL